MTRCINILDVPTEDFENNIITKNFIGSHIDGVVRAQFSRKRDTGDRRMDHKFSDSKCYKFLFPISSGKLNKNGQILKHDIAPIVTDREICVKSCHHIPSNESFREDGVCQTSFKYPTNCEIGKCDYVAKWSYNESAEEVLFEISSLGIGRWTGIGFSRDGNMANSDIYTGWMYGNKAFVIDRFAYGRQLPAIDPVDRQDIYDIGGKMEDNYQVLIFNKSSSIKFAQTFYI